MNGRQEKVSVISHRPVTSSDLKHERLFFRGSVSTFLQLVVAFLVTRSTIEHSRVFYYLTIRETTLALVVVLVLES